MRRRLSRRRPTSVNRRRARNRRFDPEFTERGEKPGVKPETVKSRSETVKPETVKPETVKSKPETVK
jgi:hypothetical protein